MKANYSLVLNNKVSNNNIENFKHSIAANFCFSKVYMREYLKQYDNKENCQHPYV